MYKRNDPRLRRTLNEISQTIESANESAQARVFTFGQDYVSPCLHSIYSCFGPCVDHCFPLRDQRGRRLRRQSRGRPELNFDFYDDWEEDETDGLLGWGDDEYDSFTAASGGHGTNSERPARQRAMSYGARRDARGRKIASVKGLEAVGESSAGPAPSYLGFFGKITGKLGKGKGLRYKPSAAGLQEHPGGHKKLMEDEEEPLITEDSEGDVESRRRRRNRSGTAGSGHTTDSLSSRGDLFPSEDEDDAVPLDDEFAMVLERRTTNSGQDDESNGPAKSGKRPSLGSRRSTRTRSSRSTPRSKMSSRAASTVSSEPQQALDPETIGVPTLDELYQEEERARVEEEAAVEQRREAAQRLATERGLSTPESPVSQRQRAGSSATPTQREDDVAKSDILRTSTLSDTAQAPLSAPVTAGSRSYEERPVASTDEPTTPSSFAAAKLPRFGT